MLLAKKVTRFCINTLFFSTPLLLLSPAKDKGKKRTKGKVCESLIIDVPNHRPELVIRPCHCWRRHRRLSTRSRPLQRRIRIHIPPHTPPHRPPRTLLRRARPHRRRAPTTRRRRCAALPRPRCVPRWHRCNPRTRLRRP
jgi:hypothetical protein